MSRALDVLVIEDSEKDAALILRELRKSGRTISARRVATARALSMALEARRWDLVLADFELPGFDGFAALELVRRSDGDVPCVVVSGRIGEEVAVEAMRAGAADFVPKDRLVRLIPVVERELRDAEVRRERARERRRRAAQQAVGALLAAGRSAREVVAESLGPIAQSAELDLAALFRWSPRERVLRCVATWSAVPRPSLEAELRARALPAGAGVAGRALETGEAQWVADLTLEGGYPEAAAAGREGLRSVVAVPIPTGDGACCVIELFCTRARERDEDLIDALRAVAWQLGQALGRERALDALRESEAHKAAVIEGSLDGIVTADDRGRIVELNPAAERMFGYTLDEVRGKDLAEVLLPPSLRETHRREIARFLATGRTTLVGRRIELPGMRKGGTEFPAEVSIARVDRSGRPLFSMFVRDVTESARLLSALQRAEARQRVLAEVGAALVESLDQAAVLPRIAVLLTNEIADWCAIHVIADGRLEQAAASHRLSEKTPDIEELWRRRPPTAECEVGPARVVQDARPQRLARVTPDDIVRIARDEEEARRIEELGAGSYLAVPLLARGEAVGALTLVREPGRPAFEEDDLELLMEIGRRCAIAIENARLYREVQESLRARDDFLMIAAHELATPLTPLRMRAQELARVLAEDQGGAVATERIAGSVRAIDRSSRRLAELVERLLDVSRVTVGRIALERTRFDLVQLAREVVAELADELERAGSRVEWSVPSEPVEGEWDRRRLAIGLRSLLSNALKFGGGLPITVSIRRDGERVHVSVRDEGPGLSVAEVSRLFERFARPAPLSEYGGFGLGLWIVRRIAEEHGGSVEVLTSPGQGACFGIVLPAS
ncbi:MAG: PAS domain S-box protein [Sandaracinaceae bacterium]|nr:PAS domain S-box protein [Sandaracinaceae bacterium]